MRSRSRTLEALEQLAAPGAKAPDARRGEGIHERFESVTQLGRRGPVLGSGFQAGQKRPAYGDRHGVAHPRTTAELGVGRQLVGSPVGELTRKGLVDRGAQAPDVLAEPISPKRAGSHCSGAM